MLIFCLRCYCFQLSNLNVQRKIKKCIENTVTAFLRAPDSKTEDIFLGIFLEIWEVKTIKLDIKNIFGAQDQKSMTFCEYLFSNLRNLKTFFVELGWGASEFLSPPGPEFLSTALKVMKRVNE